MLTAKKLSIQAALSLGLLASATIVQATLLTPEEQQVQFTPESVHQESSKEEQIPLILSAPSISVPSTSVPSTSVPSMDESKSLADDSIRPVLFQRELVDHQAGNSLDTKEELQPYSLVHGLVYASFGFLLVVLGVAGSRYNKI